MHLGTMDARQVMLGGVLVGGICCAHMIHVNSIWLPSDLAPFVHDHSNHVILRLISCHRTLIPANFIQMLESFRSFYQWTFTLLLMIIQIFGSASDWAGARNPLYVLFLVRFHVQIAILTDIAVIVLVHLWVSILAVCLVMIVFPVGQITELRILRRTWLSRV